MKGEFKQILFEIFTILGLSEEEKVGALESFKGKFVLVFLNSIKSNLSQENQEWIDKNNGTDFNQDDPKIAEIQQAIKNLYPEDQLYQKTKEVFRTVLKDYVQFMSSDIEPEKVTQLENILAKV